jgi:D-lyxose ketol-isomerase
VGIAVGLGFIFHHTFALDNRLLFAQKIMVCSWLEVCAADCHYSKQSDIEMTRGKLFCTLPKSYGDWARGRQLIIVVRSPAGTGFYCLM